MIAYLQLPEAERRAAIRNAFDALIPGGTFLLVGHDSTNMAEGTGGPQYPEVLYTAEDVLADLAGRDFESVAPSGSSETWSASTGRPASHSTLWCG